MSTENLHDSVISRLTEQSDAIGHLAQDSGGFSAVVAAFESKDSEAFRWVLERLEFLPYCEVICEWVRVKLGVLRCIEVCGWPIDKKPFPSLHQFARAIVQLSSNEELLRRVVDAVACGNREEYQKAISELKLSEFCYLICHWVYLMSYRRVCEVVCTPERLPVRDALNEIRSVGKVLGEIVEKEDVFSELSKAVIALDCQLARSVIERVNFGRYCELFCGLICTWRAG